MKIPTALALALSATLTTLAAPVLAEGPPVKVASRAAPEEAEADAASPETPAAKRKKPLLGPQGAWYTGASVSSSPHVLLGWFPAEDLTIAGGLGMTLNGNGAAASPLTGVKGAPTDKVGADAVLALAYFIVDKFPFATGPEIVFTGSLAPANPFDTVVVSPMWALRYAPWAAPIAIGTDIGVSVSMTRGAKPVAGLTTSGLDILFAF